MGIFRRSMVSDHDYTNFIYWRSNGWNTDNTVDYMITDKSSYAKLGPSQTISDFDIDAYRSTKLDDGTWRADLD